MSRHTCNVFIATPIYEWKAAMNGHIQNCRDKQLLTRNYLHRSLHRAHNMHLATKIVWGGLALSDLIYWPKILYGDSAHTKAD